jgi:hypothetical protein
MESRTVNIGGAVVYNSREIQSDASLNRPGGMSN